MSLKWSEMMIRWGWWACQLSDGKWRKSPKAHESPEERIETLTFSSSLQNWASSMLNCKSSAFCCSSFKHFSSCPTLSRSWKKIELFSCFMIFDRWRRHSKRWCWLTGSWCAFQKDVHELITTMSVRSDKLSYARTILPVAVHGQIDVRTHADHEQRDQTDVHQWWAQIRYVLCPTLWCHFWQGRRNCSVLFCLLFFFDNLFSSIRRKNEIDLNK